MENTDNLKELLEHSDNLKKMLEASKDLEEAKKSLKDTFTSFLSEIEEELMKNKSIDILTDDDIN